jgi:excisionase family DNA binding protein
MAGQRREVRVADGGAADQGQERTVTGQGGGLTSEDPLLTPEQVAVRLQISPFTLMHWLRTGRLPGVKLAKFWRVRASALEAFLQGPQPKGSTRAGTVEAGMRRWAQAEEANPPARDGARAGAVLLALIQTLFPEGQPIPARLAYGLTTFPLHGVNRILAQYGLVLHAAKARRPAHRVACADKDGRVYFYGVFELRRLAAKAP